MPAVAGLYGARVLILPLVFVCCSVSVDFTTMLLLAFLCGFLWDAQHTLSPQGGDPAIYSNPVESLRFGYSIILYAMMGLFMQGIQPLFSRIKWQVASILTGIAVFLYLFSEYLLLNFVRGEFTFPSTIFYRIYLTSALTMFFTPLVFWIIHRSATLCQHTLVYDGLTRQRRYFG